MRRSNKPYVIAWLLFALLVVAGWRFNIWQHEQQKARAAAARHAGEAARRAAMAAPSRVPAIFEQAVARWRSGEGPKPTTQVVAELLYAPQPFNPAVDGWGLDFWTDPHTRARWTLTFKDDVWVHAAQGEPRINDPAPRPVPLLAEADRAVPAITRHGRGVLLALAALALLTIRLRPAAFLAHASVMASIAYIAVQFFPDKLETFQLRADRPERCGPALLTIGLGALAIWLHHRPRRRRAGQPLLCEACGYDLTANLSGVCPECGEMITPPLVTPHGNPEDGNSHIEPIRDQA